MIRPVQRQLVSGGIAAVLMTSGSAWADDDQRYWELVNDALMVEALDGNLEHARSRYEDLVHNHLPSGDPALSETLYWLGEVRYLLGDVEGARRALDECNRTGLNKARCLDLRGEIDLREDSIETVPVRWTFDSPDHGFFHPRAYWDKGSIRISRAPTGEGSVLAWSTTVDPRKEDKLVVGFHNPTPTPSSLHMDITSVRMDGVLRVIFEDVRGHLFGLSSTLKLRQGATESVDIDLTELKAIDPTSTHAFDPALLHRVVVEDITRWSGRRGANELHLDNFEVR